MKWLRFFKQTPHGPQTLSTPQIITCEALWLLKKSLGFAHARGGYYVDPPWYAPWRKRKYVYNPLPESATDTVHIHKPSRS